MPIKSHSILVVGGAGYIGSHMVLALKKAGYHPIVFDNLSKGHRKAVLDAELIVGEMGDKNVLIQVFSNYHFSAVMHFAALIEVAESVKYPEKYYQNNVVATLNLLDVMREHHVNKFIFSSTAAVYGEPSYTPIDEAHPIAPVNPYGKSKWMGEEIIQDYANNDALHYAILRYFNAAGADPSGRLGEQHEPESHLIPLLLQVAAGKKKQITLYGSDYATPDGTPVRDYVHVVDLCAAHLLALQALLSGRKKILCNLGLGHGYSVQQVIEAVRRITLRDISVINGPRRAGDPAILVADARLAKQELAWQPQYADLEVMIQHAWRFMGSR